MLDSVRGKFAGLFTDTVDAVEGAEDRMVVEADEKISRPRLSAHCSVPVVGCDASGARCKASGARFEGCDARFEVFGTCFEVSGARCKARFETPSRGCDCDDCDGGIG